MSTHDAIRKAIEIAESKGLLVVEVDTSAFEIELRPEWAFEERTADVRIRISGYDPLRAIERLPDFSTVDKPVDTVEKSPRGIVGEARG